MATDKKQTPKKNTTKKTSSAKTTTKKTAKETATAGTQKVVAGINKAEKAVDGAMDRVSKATTEKLGAKNTARVQEIAEKADEIAGKVGEFADQADKIAQDMLPEAKGSDVELTMEYSASVSRLFFLRFLWLIIEYWVIVVWGIWIGLVSIVHFFYMIIMGKRNRTMRNEQYRFMRHITKRSMYLKGMTDKRPEFITPAAS